MISSTHELPPRSNYFAESAYLDHNLGSGTIRNRAGARIIVLGDDLLVASLNTIERELGERGAAVVRDIGRDWGSRAAKQFAAEMANYFGRPLMELPLALFAANLTEAFHHHGWGAFHLDFSQYAQGLLVIEVQDPVIGSVVKATATPVEGLLAAFLAGMFSHFAGVELDSLQTECRGRGAPMSRFVLTVPERLQLAEQALGNGKSHNDVVEELTKK